ncbi:MAG: hypothetical protein IKD69_02710, partial [Solobacterium sp.]|nr:hypothetical protein [Solobacterium sp.]
VRALPVKWLKPRFTGITEEAEKYFEPLIQGSVDLLMENGLPAYAMPYYLRDDVIRVERK